MKFLWFLAFTYFFSFQEKKIEENKTAQVKVVIKNLKNKKGKVFIGLYETSKAFPKPEKVSKGFKITPQEAEKGYIVEVLQNKSYAFAIFHDENNNGELDKNTWGIPKEGYAFSNNVMGTFGPPSFEKASFTCNGVFCTQYIDLNF